MTTNSRTLAVIITFNPTKELINNISSLHYQVDEILLVDNGSNSTTLSFIDNCKSKYKDITIIYNNNNLGIAKALNIGIKYGYEHDFKWCLTFDQDSKVTEGYVKNLINAFSSFKMKDKLVVVGPTYVNQPDYKLSDESIDRDINTRIVKTIMTSGNLINLDNLRKSSVEFKEEFFVDYVDHEFCFNLRKRGYYVIQTENVILLHNLGSITEHNLFGRKVKTTNHNFIRRYYITRNRWCMYKKYFSFDFLWVTLDVKCFIVEILKIFLFEDNKILKYLSILNGLRDFVRGKFGKYTVNKSNF